jgi:hypothetical protein
MLVFEGLNRHLFFLSKNSNLHLTSALQQKTLPKRSFSWTTAEEVNVSQDILGTPFTPLDPTKLVLLSFISYPELTLCRHHLSLCPQSLNTIKAWGRFIMLTFLQEYQDSRLVFPGIKASVLIP